MGDRIVCPVHKIPDCSALLNGCSIPSWAHRLVRQARAEALQEAAGASSQDDTMDAVEDWLRERADAEGGQPTPTPGHEHASAAWLRDTWPNVPAADSRRAVAVLHDTYTDQGVRTYLNSPNRHLGDETPLAVIERGEGARVVDVVDRLVEAMG